MTERERGIKGKTVIGRINTKEISLDWANAFLDRYTDLLQPQVEAANLTTQQLHFSGMTTDGNMLMIIFYVGDDKPDEPQDMAVGKGNTYMRVMVESKNKKGEAIWKALKKIP